VARHPADRFSRQALAHSDFLMRLARKLTGDNATAEDLFQDTYLKAFKSFDSFEGESRCRAWLKRIMLNTYINMYNRKQKITFYQRDNSELSELPGRTPDNIPQNVDLNEDNILRNFVCDRIRNSLLLLPDEYRLAIILYDMLGISYKEISETLGLPIGTVKSRLFRGRKFLKHNLLDVKNNGYGHRCDVCGLTV